MPAVIDEPTAWSLVQTVPRPLETDRLPIRVPHNHLPDVWLQVRADKGWDTSVRPTGRARDVLDLYLPLQLREEFTLGQIGQSVDGRIATENGRSHYITGPADLTHLHRLRALADAVVVGAGTVAADNPRLTVRRVEGQSPVRVVLDPEGRLDARQSVFSDGAAPTLHVRRALDGQEPPSSSGARCEVVRLPADATRTIDPHALLHALRERGLRRILVEGGGVTVSRFLEAGALDRLHLTVAPLIIGSGRPSLTLPPIDSLDDARRPACRRFDLGADVLFDFDLRSAP